jgi:transposase
VVLEATGKLEQLAVSELAAAGLPVVVVNPAQVRHYAKARGKRAKTDPIDARLIAEFARDLQPELRPLPDAETQALAALCQRRKPTAGDGADGKKPPATSPTGQSEEHQSDAGLLAAAD